MDVLDKAFANVYSLLTVTIALTQFGSNVPYKLWENRSATVLSDRALINFHRLSIVTNMLLTEGVWPQFAMQVFGVQ